MNSEHCESQISDATRNTCTMYTLAACDLSVDVLCYIVRHQCSKPKPDKSEPRFSNYNLKALAQFQIFSKSMKSAVSAVLREIKTLSLAYPLLVTSNTYQKAQSKPLTIETFISGTFLSAMIARMQVVKVKWNWNQALNESYRWDTLLIYASYHPRPLSKITALRLNISGRYDRGPQQIKLAQLYTLFPLLRSAKFQRNDCASIPELIEWVNAFFGKPSSAEMTTKLFLRLMEPMKAIGSQVTLMDTESRQIFNLIVTKIHSITREASHYDVRENSVKIVLKSTNEKTIAIIYLRPRTEAPM